MTVLVLSLYCVVGRLLIYVLQEFPLESVIFIGKIFEREFFKKLLGCDFCLGCWVYFALSFLFGTIFEPVFYVSVLSEFLTGITASFFVHLIRIGWTTKFSVIEIN